MKEQYKRVFAAILALLLTGCTSPAPQSEAESKVETKQSAETTAAETAETETDRAHARDSLPDRAGIPGKACFIAKNLRSVCKLVFTFYTFCAII